VSQHIRLRHRKNKRAQRRAAERRLDIQRQPEMAAVPATKIQSVPIDSQAEPLARAAAAETASGDSVEVVDGQPKKGNGGLVKDSTATFMYRLLIFALTFLTGVVVTRTLAPDQKGAYNLAMALPRLLIRFGNLGIGDASIYEIGKKRYSLQQIAGNTFSIGLLVSVLLIGFTLMLQGPLTDSFLKGVDPILLYLALATIPFALLIDFAQDLLRGARDINGYNISRMSHNLFLFITSIIFLVALRLGTSGAMTAAFITVIGEALLVLLMLRRYTKLSLGLDRNLIGDMGGFGLKASVMQIVMYLNYDFDIFIVNYFSVDTAAVGFYSLAAGLAETLWYFPNAITVVLFPNIASDIKRGGELTPKACRHVLLLTFCSSVALAIASPLLPLVYGERYAPMIWPLLLLLPGVVTLSVFKVLSTGFFGRGQPMIASWAALIGLVFQTILDIVLIPRLGINGAAMASSLAYTLMTVLGIIFYVRATGVPVRSIFVMQGDDWRVYKKLIALPFQRIQRLRGVA
jgi:O-antigen/teichoic acid export membrane protein